ncbi:MAG TPA: SLC13 family permease [Fervidobacterium nodosum]|nr:SLC13 family permease [Fervidobacterium nodosum]
MNFLVFLLYILAYLLIIFRPKTASVTTFLIAISSLIVLNNTNFENIGEIVDFNTLLILFGMMVIVSVMKEKGVFIGVSNAIIDFSKGNFFKMLVLINVGVFFLSGFLDNVTTILIFFPILFYLSDVLNLDSRVLGLNAILFSNIGGMSTAIGDPPNIVIYSVSKIPFLDFITNIMPIALILLIIQLVILRKGIKFEQTSFQRQERNVVNKNWKYYLLYFIGVIFLMAFHDKFKLELGFITILSGLTLLFFESEDFNSRIQDIDLGHAIPHFWTLHS